MNKKFLIGILLVTIFLVVACCLILRNDEAKPNKEMSLPVTETTVMPTELAIPEGEGVENLPVILNDTDDSTEPTEKPTQLMENTYESHERDSEQTNSVETYPVETTAPTVSDETTAATESSGEDEGYCCAYAEYLTWDAQAQQNYMNSFASPMEYIEWCRAGEEAHSNHKTTIEVEGGELNIGDYID